MPAILSPSTTAFFEPIVGKIPQEDLFYLFWLYPTLLRRDVYVHWFDAVFPFFGRYLSSKGTNVSLVIGSSDADGLHHCRSHPENRQGFSLPVRLTFAECFLPPEASDEPQSAVSNHLTSFLAAVCNRLRDMDVKEVDGTTISPPRLLYEFNSFTRDGRQCPNLAPQLDKVYSAPIVELATSAFTTNGLVVYASYSALHGDAEGDTFEALPVASSLAAHDIPILYDINSVPLSCRPSDILPGAVFIPSRHAVYSDAFNRLIAMNHVVLFIQPDLRALAREIITHEVIEFAGDAAYIGAGLVEIYKAVSRIIGERRQAEATMMHDGMATLWR